LSSHRSHDIPFFSSTEISLLWENKNKHKFIGIISLKPGPRDNGTSKETT